MFKYLTVTILIILFAGLVIPQIALAGRFPFQGPLVPCGTKANPEKCGLCHFFELGQNIIDLFITIIVFLAPLMIVIGGIVLLTSAGVPERASQGKRMITYTIVGLAVTFLAWVIINTIMIKLANPNAMPWPWNDIDCKPGESITPSPPLVTKGEYCVCEVPVYDLDPNQYPAQASKVGTNIKVTKLADKDTCEQMCVSGNFGNYCPSTLKQDEAKLYCASESSVKGKRACGVAFTTQETSIDCQISNECFATDNDCIATVTPTLPAFNKEYAQKCFVNGEDLCNYRILKGGNSYCPNKYPSPCTSADRKFALYRWKSEISKFESNAYDCSRNAYANTNIVCRLDCQYDKLCRKPETNWCSDVKDSFSCFGSFTCKNMTTSQPGDASPELKQFLTCIGGKLPSGAKIITSISDNSKYKCFDLNYWDEKGQCSGTTDSCSGTCCGHSRSSLHYGGIPGTVDCRKESYAVDFGHETVKYKTEIKSAIKECLKPYKGTELNEAHLCDEGNHLHIQLTGVSKYHRCGTGLAPNSTCEKIEAK